MGVCVRMCVRLCVKERGTREGDGERKRGKEGKGGRWGGAGGREREITGFSVEV